jgi:hypothetical protein
MSDVSSSLNSMPISLPVTRVKVQSTPQKSKFTFSKRKNPPPSEFQSYDTAINMLKEKHKMSFTEAEIALTGLWERAFAKEEPGVLLAELNGPTREMFKFFKWHRASNGTVVKYVRTSTSCEEYAFSEDLIGTSHTIYFTVAIKGEKKKISLFEWMNTRYAKLLNSGELFKRPIKKDVVSTDEEASDMVVEYMTLSDYWNKMVEMYWEQDSNFKFKDQSY